jgi:hypothetical protein
VNCGRELKVSVLLLQSFLKMHFCPKPIPTKPYLLRIPTEELYSWSFVDGQTAVAGHHGDVFLGIMHKTFFYPKWNFILEDIHLLNHTLLVARTQFELEFSRRTEPVNLQIKSFRGENLKLKGAHVNGYKVTLQIELSEEESDIDRFIFEITKHDKVTQLAKAFADQFLCIFNPTCSDFIHSVLLKVISFLKTSETFDIDDFQEVAGCGETTRQLYKVIKCNLSVMKYIALLSQTGEPILYDAAEAFRVSTDVKKGKGQDNMTKAVATAEPESSGCSGSGVPHPSQLPAESEVHTSDVGQEATEEEGGSGVPHPSQLPDTVIVTIPENASITKVCSLELQI